MSTLDRLLHDEMNRLVDRRAASAPEGAAAALAEQDPELHARMLRVEARLARLRQSLLDDYRQWQETIDECEDLWGLASLKASEASADAFAPAVSMPAQRAA
jgi:hypothetical protein